MRLSTRVQYGVRMMISLAKRYVTGPMHLKEIAREENISEKYLSLIVIPLRGLGLVKSFRGARGGYMLAKSPSQITLKEVMDILEGECLVECIKDPASCSRVATCASRDFWSLLEGKISETLGSFTLEDLVRIDAEKTRKSPGVDI